LKGQRQPPVGGKYGASVDLEKPREGGETEGEESLSLANSIIFMSG